MKVGSLRVETTQSDRRGRALIAGGEQMLRRGLTKTVGDLGFETTASPAASLLDHSVEDFDLVIALVTLDSLDGYSLLDSLTRSDTPTPVVAVGPREIRGKVVEKLLGRPLAYLTLPLRDLKLRDAIERVLTPVPQIEDAPTQPFQQSWERPDIRIAEIIEVLHSGEIQLPTIAPIAMDLQALLRRPTAGVESIVGVVEQDPAVASDVLRLANSSRYRAIVPITTLRNACLRLGNKTVVALAQEALLRDLFALGAGPVQQLARAMWENVIVTSQGARRIAIAKGMEDADEIQVAAMFHNLGELVLLRATAGLYRDARNWENPIFLAGIGREIARNHEAVGAMLLESWGLDDRYVRIARHHHQPEEGGLSVPERIAADTVMAAWAGACHAGYGWRLGSRRVHARDAMNRLRLSESAVAQIFEEADNWLDGSLPVAQVSS
ncbi:MAG: HDOD domain-containing protein [Myxococcota bacterium]|nr:HDOD domain-containing protein [Myxococcota bacterium]